MARFRVVVCVVAGLLGSAGWPRSSTAQSTFRLGTEFQVNGHTANSQSRVAVARAASGNFVVAWQSLDQDGSDLGIFGARFNSLGVRLGTEFSINSVTGSRQSSPAIGVEDDGAFVVAWSHYTGAGAQLDIFARRFNSAGAPQGSEFQVNVFTPAFQESPAIALDNDGDFVVAWEGRSDQDGSSTGIFARRFDSVGVAKGAEFQVTTYTLDYQLGPAVALDADGDFVVAWMSEQDGDGFGIFSRRFTSAGVAGVEVLTNVRTSGGQGTPAVAIDSDGEFVVSWTGTDGDASGVFARRFNALGAPSGGEFQVHAATLGVQYDGAVTMDPEGDFVIAWPSRVLGNSSTYDIFARRFDSAGVPGSEFQVSTFTPGYQVHPVVAMDSNEGFVVAWDSLSQDGSDYGVFAQRFTTLAVLDVDGDGTFGPLTDALLILRFAFGFTGPSLTAGAVGSGCTRCDASAIASYLATLV
jgi:hypothetical protein